MNKIEHLVMYLVVEGISIPILMLCLSSLEIYDIQHWHDLSYYTASTLLGNTSVLIWLNKAVKLLSILINTLGTHRCSAFTKDLLVIKIRVAHFVRVLCSPIMCLYALGSVLLFPHRNDGWFVFTSSCL